MVIHGTDTMAFATSMLSFMLENLQKSVILTGAQVPCQARAFLGPQGGHRAGARGTGAVCLALQLLAKATPQCHDPVPWGW